MFASPEFCLEFQIQTKLKAQRRTQLELPACLTWGWNYAKSLYLVWFQIAAINPYADPRRCFKVHSVFHPSSLEIFGNFKVFYTVCQNFRFIRKPDISISLSTIPPKSFHSSNTQRASVNSIFLLKIDVE